jgi:UPF0271 protein
MLQLNSDLGEGYGHWQLADEAAIMPHLDMANVACGFHAGDPLTLTRTLQLAREHGVTVGAHPGYPDRVGFGRRTIPMEPDELRAMFAYQIGALDALARAEGLRLAYVKPHGALYNDMMRDEAIFVVLTKAMAQSYPDLPLMILSTADNDRYRKKASEHGIRLLFEFFADRAYMNNGKLMPRSEPGAVIHDTDTVLERVRQIVVEGSVTTAGGTRLPLPADTICVHGDNPEAIALTRAIRELVDRLG